MNQVTCQQAAEALEGLYIFSRNVQTGAGGHEVAATHTKTLKQFIKEQHEIENEIFTNDADGNGDGMREPAGLSNQPADRSTSGGLG